MPTVLKHVANISELPPETNRAYNVDGLSVLLCHTKLGVFAVENRCSHQLATLEGGRMRSCYLFCPKHSLRFDLRSGAPSGNLSKNPIQTYAVKVEGDAILVELPS